MSRRSYGEFSASVLGLKGRQICVDSPIAEPLGAVLILQEGARGEVSSRLPSRRVGEAGSQTARAFRPQSRVRTMARPTKSRRRVLRRRGEEGASLVEFAIVVPVFALLLFAMIDFGLVFQSY